MARTKAKDHKHIGPQSSEYLEHLIGQMLHVAI
jgi:hypothetical protein